MEETLVELSDVVIRRRRTVTLGPLSLRVRRGEFWGVVGPNGAGKSTLLRTVAGMERPVSGEAHTLGLPAAGRSGRAALRRRVGFLFQHHDFLPDVPLLVGDVVMFGRAGLPGTGRSYRREDREAARAAIERMGLGELRERLYRELSGGERQKVQLARLLAQEPDIMLLDEPTAGLDLDWQERLTQTIGRMHRE